MNSAEYREIWRHENRHLTPGTSRRQWGAPVKLSPRGTLDTDHLINEVQKEKERKEYLEQWKREHGQQEAPPPPRQAPLDPRGQRSRDPSPQQQPQGLNIRPPVVAPSRREAQAADNNMKDGYSEVWRQQHPEARGYKPAAPQSQNMANNRGYLDTDAIIRDVQREKQEEEDRRRAANYNNRTGPSPKGFGTTGGGGLDNDEYRKIWERNQQRGYQGRPANQQTDDYKATSLLANESDAAKLQKIKERNDEYNQFLANKGQQGGKGGNSGQGSNYATLPGLRYSNSAQRRNQEEERNKEYNEMMRNKAQQRQRGGAPPPAEPKQGWGTPTYEEMLDKKRAQESQYRRANDISHEPDLNVKEGAPTPVPLTGRRSQNDGQYFATLPLGGVSMTEEQRRKEEYKRDLQRQMAETSFARKKEKIEGSLVNNTGAIHLPESHVYIDPYVRPARRVSTLPYNVVNPDLAKLDAISPRSNAILGRRQPTGDLRAEGGLNLSRNLAGDRLTNLNLDVGILDRPSINNQLDPPAGLQYQPSTFITANANSLPATTSVDEAYNYYANLNPLDPTTTTIQTEQASHCSHCQCSCHEMVSGKGGGGYRDIDRGGGGGGSRGGGRRGGRTPDVPSLDLGGGGYADPGQPSRVRFKEQRRAAVGMDFDDDNSRKTDKTDATREYREELERQMKEKNMRKQKDKEDRERFAGPKSSNPRYELKMEEEARNYDPFGKGGGGAPMRDATGNVISDLRQIRDNNTNRTPRPGLGDGGGGGGGQRVDEFRLDFRGDAGPGGDLAAGNVSRGATSYRDDLIGPPPLQTTADGEASFARGGHGIFGAPKTDVEKTQADKYKDDLKKQIEQKKAEEYRKKQLEKLEEEREQKILDAQRERMQREYEEEQKKLKEKEEAARAKNEEMIRAAEEKKKAAERARREAEDRADAERREELERERREKEKAAAAAAPPASPPVPAARTKTRTENPEPESQVPSRRDHAPREPARETREPRAGSADVLNQLAGMREQLRKERQRVQNMLDEKEDDVEIYDPRQVQRPPPAPIVQIQHKDQDVFETALNRAPVAVRRTPGDRPNSTAMETFNALKHKNDSDSRKQFREMFPGKPATDYDLESEQAALLRDQEQRLRNLKDKRDLEDTSGLRIGRDLHSSSSQLASNSAFVEVNGVGSFPDDFEDMPRRNESARQRRRQRATETPRIDRIQITTPDFASRNAYDSRATFGSQTSLNVDKLAKKNEDRLRRLRDIQGDDVSLYDPEDVLDRFMTKQGHNRPPSRNTLLDDTWMRAGSTQARY